MRDTNKTVFPEIVRPKAGSVIGEEFVVCGWIPKTWLYLLEKYYLGSVGVEIVDMGGRPLMGLSVFAKRDWLFIFRKKIWFEGKVDISPMLFFWEKDEERRVLLVISGATSRHAYEVPVVVKNAKISFSVEK